VKDETIIRATRIIKSACLALAVVSAMANRVDVAIYFIAGAILADALGQITFSTYIMAMLSRITKNEILMMDLYLKLRERIQKAGETGFE
jgi:hypothetical protein